MQVRAELCYPIMVTPLSQFVGSQAAINVIVGERYKEVTDQIIQYALGYWGREGAELLDPFHVRGHDFLMRLKAQAAGFRAGGAHLVVEPTQEGHVLQGLLRETDEQTGRLPCAV